MNVPLDKDAPAEDAMDAALTAQLQPLCSRVEAELGKPAVILVTSAMDGDGKGITAHSLVNCFAHFGHSAELINLRSGGGSWPAAQDRVAALVKQMRSDCDFTIVEVGTFLDSGCALALARLVDGVLLVVRTGRAPAHEDRLMLQTIQHCRGRIIGVVMTSHKAVLDFERRNTGSRPASAAGSAALARRENGAFGLARKTLAMDDPLVPPTADSTR